MVGTPKKIDPELLEAIKGQVASLKDSVLQEILAALAQLRSSGLPNNVSQDTIVDDDEPVFIPSNITKEHNAKITVQEEEVKEGELNDAIAALRRSKKAGGNDE